MVGVIIVAHMQLAEELLKVAQIITSSTLDNFMTVSINLDDNPDHAREKLLKAVKAVDNGDGVIIIVDMFGGTPSNLSLSLLNRGEIEIVTGANLPMIIEAASNSQKVSLKELVSMLTSSGQKEIRSACEVLDKKVAERKER
jgi:PTS system mannose-specific IIA component